MVHPDEEENLGRVVKESVFSDSHKEEVFVEAVL